MITELGRLVFDVKVETVGNNKKVVNNRIAIQQGKNKSTFVDIVAWGHYAELIGNYYKKGYEIYIEGHLVNKTRKKDDVEFTTVAINVDNIKFTNGNPKEDIPYTGDVENFL